MISSLSLFVARRYFFSRKQKTVINVISWISLVGIAVSTTALIVVLSVYNGIGLLTQGLFNSFDPPLLVQPAKGKTFHTADIDYAALQRLPGVAAVSQLVEENAWITYRHNEAIVSLRGVDAQYPLITGLDTLLYEGVYLLREEVPIAPPEGYDDDLPPATTVQRVLLGAEVYYNLGIREASNLPLAIRIPKRGTALGMTVDEAFNTGYALPGGNFYIQQDIDNRYVVADIDFTRDLNGYSGDECTALAIALQPHARPERVKQQVRSLLNGNDSTARFTVKDRFEQQPVYYKVFRSERLGIYLILALIVLISTLNLVASLTLLILDKRKDIATLRSLGLRSTDLRRIFRIEGVLITSVGVVTGLFLGFVICFLQQQFGIVKMGDNFVVSAFPVAMRLSDFLTTFLLVMGLGTFAVLLSVRKSKI
ncbi:MAG: ABC transporter permease [Bacteroidales bacterium]|nr:ABC transporter permease [Bacteroidales bacterium]